MTVILRVGIYFDDDQNMFDHKDIKVKNLFLAQAMLDEIKSDLELKSPNILKKQVDELRSVAREHKHPSYPCVYVGNDAWSCGHIDNVG